MVLLASRLLSASVVGNRTNLQGWHAIEIKNVLPTNSNVKENQLVRIDLDLNSLDLESTRNMSVAYLKLLV